MDNKLAFLFTDYFSDINGLGFSYAKQLKGIGVFSASVKAINYDDFEHNEDIQKILDIARTEMKN